MKSVKIFGAGSIGNHLAHAFRTRGFRVILTDLNAGALERAKSDIYVSRYGKWDNEIELKLSSDAIRDETDVVFIGTPPESHIPLALQVLEKNSPKLILIEKPLCTPALKDMDRLMRIAKEKNVEVCVGYNHVVSKASLYMSKMLNREFLGDVETISGYTREHWGGIFKAHHWLSGPKDSYLGYYLRGGGALCEHSHGLNMWQHIAASVNAGKIVEVNATIDFYKDDVLSFDKIAVATLKTDKGIVGDLIQDVVTYPAKKSAKVQGTNGYAEIVLSVDNSDIVRYGNYNATGEEEVFKKNRPDDFLWEVEHIERIIDGSISNNMISLERGVSTMIVIDAIFRSAHAKCPVEIDWQKYNII